MENRKNVSLNIFDYIDYRQYLKDYFQKAKENDPHFSHRFVAEKLGLSTSNLILLIIQGKRNLTKTLGFKLSKFLRHSKKESLYFENMTTFLQAKNEKEKDVSFLNMLQLKQNLQIASIQEDQSLIFSQWYHIVIRELITREDFNGDITKIAASLNPSINPSQVEESIALLENLGLIKKQEDKYIQSNPLIFFEQKPPSSILDSYFQKTAQLGCESINRTAPHERYISSFSLSLSKDRFEEMIKECVDLRNKFFSFAQDATPSNKVYQVNIQIFPVSK